MLNRSSFVDNVPQLLEEQGERLRMLVGQQLREIWVAWDNEVDELFKDEAAILRVGSTQVEIACIKLSDVAVTWNLVDLESKPRWVADWGDLKLEWRRHAPFAALEGQTIVGVNVVEYQFTTTVVFNSFNPIKEGKKDSSWLLVGLEFELRDDILSIVNGLDSTLVLPEALVGSEFRKTNVSVS